MALTHRRAGRWQARYYTGRPSWDLICPLCQQRLYRYHAECLSLPRVSAHEGVALLVLLGGEWAQFQHTVFACRREFVIAIPIGSTDVLPRQHAMSRLLRIRILAWSTTESGPPF